MRVSKEIWDSYSISGFTIDCTGDCVVGDVVVFERAVFSGSYRKPKFSHMETIAGEIVKDSYGTEKQQHTFTLELDDGSKMRIKGRNLYRNGTLRKEWEDESKRNELLDEKHERGNTARVAREIRKNGYILED